MTTPNQQPLNEYLRVQVRADRELNRVLELAAKQSAERIRSLELKPGDSIGTRVRVSQFRGVLSALSSIQRGLWTGTGGVGDIIGKYYSNAQAASRDSFGIIERVLETALGTRRADALIEGFRVAAANGLELDRTRRARLLSPRVWKNADLSSGMVERAVRAGIIQGLSARELARNVRQYVSPSTPGGVSYAAMRLARTELNNAFHEANKIHAAEAPWVGAVHWRLSGSHPKNKPDRCDILAGQDMFDLGPGRYPADQVPDKPHPQCLCFTTYETVSESDMLDMLPGLIRQQSA